MIVVNNIIFNVLNRNCIVVSPYKTLQSRQAVISNYQKEECPNMTCERLRTWQSSMNLYLTKQTVIRSSSKTHQKNIRLGFFGCIHRLKKAIPLFTRDAIPSDRVVSIIKLIPWTMCVRWRKYLRALLQKNPLSAAAFLYYYFVLSGRGITISTKTKQSACLALYLALN